MFIIRCSSCRFEIKNEREVRLYGGVEVAMKIVGIGGSPPEIKRKTAAIFNKYKVPCPKCKKTDIWTWL
ncbi:MAG: hypothetical protein Q9M89_04795 [Persephonella sp.]|nr:hypothetical protein [Persephonella sp.]